MAIALRSNGQISYPILSTGASTAALAVRETRSAGAPKPGLLDPRPRSYPRQTPGPSHREGLEARVYRRVR
jgi:hypothetical protein